MARRDRYRDSGVAALHTALVVGTAVLLGVLIALALMQWFGRVT